MSGRSLLAAAFVLAGCADATAIQVRFADAEVGARAQLVVIELFAGSCESPSLCDGAPCARWTATTGEQPMGEPAELPAGAACVVASAYESAAAEPSALLARGEAPIERPVAATVEVVLRSPRVDLVAPGRGHTCASVEGVGVFCWGYNLSGEAGSGEVSDVARPGRVQLPIGEVIALASGGYPGLSQSGHSCAIVERADDGQRELYCWGNNDEGQLGNGTTTSSATPARAMVPTDALSGSVTLSAGVAHTCLAASQAGAFTWRCWGRNSEGQLGLGNTDSPVSTPPGGSAEQDISRIFTGRNHTCASNAAQRLFCWGDGRSGQTGRGLGVNADVGPQLIPRVAAVAAGAWHTCAMVDNALQCFGSNHCGQIDIANEARCLDTAVADSDVVTIADGATVNVPLQADERVDALTAGGAFTCALLSGGRVYCWGNGPIGELGIGAFGTPRGAGFVALEDGEPLEGATSVVAGEAHACAIADGALYCWGRNHHNRVQPDGLDCRGGMMPDCNQAFAGRVLLP